MGVVEKALDLRAEQQGSPHQSVVEGLDAEEVPGAEELFILLVPDDKGEHAPQLVEQVWAVLLIAVEQHLRVRLGGELVALLEQLLPQGAVVVDLPVEHEDLGAVLVQNGLAPALQVDDGESPEAQADLPVGIVVRVVRSPVADGVGHGLENALVPLGVAAADKSYESTHNVLPSFLYLSYPGERRPCFPFETAPRPSNFLFYHIFREKDRLFSISPHSWEKSQGAGLFPGNGRRALGRY